MIILPAIDIKDGSAVRLFKGDDATAHKVADSPLAALQGFGEAGAEWVHIVDLDGARDGKQVNRELIESLIKETDLKVEIGGGIRSIEAARAYLEAGAQRVIFGSVAVKQPELVIKAVAELGAEHIAVGIDARDGMVASEGWLDTSSLDYITLAKAMYDAGVRTVIFTDIARDGMLTGPNFDQLKALSEACAMNVIASGGISDITDISRLTEMNLYGAICGKSIYSGSLDLREAISVARGQKKG